VQEYKYVYSSQWFTVQTAPSLTIRNHSPPHLYDMYITPQIYTQNNNF